ncbi:MAG: hypothetical protein ABR518_01230 [Actinomycetota bacterium]
MFRRRERRVALPGVRRAHDAFKRAVADVDEAKATLFLGVPSGRKPKVPLAEAVWAFEEHLRRARDAMPSWRLEQVEDAWSECAAGLELAARRAEELRRHGASDAYEDLVPILDEVMAPLDAFAKAAARFHELGA